MNGRTYRCVLCYHLGVPLFSISKPCSACSGVFSGDIMETMMYRVLVLLVLNIDITLCVIPLSTYVFGQGFQLVKKLISGLLEGMTNPYILPDMLLYSWDGGLDVCVDLTGSSPLTQTSTVDFMR